MRGTVKGAYFEIWWLVKQTDIYIPGYLERPLGLMLNCINYWCTNNQLNRCIYNIHINNTDLFLNFHNHFFVCLFDNRMEKSLWAWKIHCNVLEMQSIAYILLYCAAQCDDVQLTSPAVRWNFSLHWLICVIWPQALLWFVFDSIHQTKSMLSGSKWSLIGAKYIAHLQVVSGLSMHVTNRELVVRE